MGGGAMKGGARRRQMIGGSDPCSDGLKEDFDCALDADGATRRISLSAGILANTRAEKLLFGELSEEKKKRTEKKRCKVEQRANKWESFPEWRALSGASGSSAAPFLRVSELLIPPKKTHIATVLRIKHT